MSNAAIDISQPIAGQLDMVSKADAEQTPSLLQDEQPTSAPRPRVLSGAALVALAAAGASPAGTLARGRVEHGVHVNSQGELKPWGSPMSEAVPSTSPAPRPDTQSAWGRSSQLVFGVGAPDEAIRIIDEVSRDYAIEIVVDPSALPGEVEVETVSGAELMPLAVFAWVTLGSGSTSSRRLIGPVGLFESFAVSGAFVSVAVFVGLRATGSPTAPGTIVGTPPTVQCYSRASRQTLALPARPSQFISNAGDESGFGVLIATACQLSSIRVHVGETATPGTTYFAQVFDQAENPETGQAATSEWPVQLGGDNGTTWPNTRSLTAGLTFGLSTTSGLYHAAAGVDLFVEAEAVQL